MFTVRRSFRFADIELSVKSECPVSVCEDAVQCNPPLPNGMRIDSCNLDSVILDCSAGDRVMIALALQLTDADEWEMSWNAGQDLDAISFESRQGNVGVVAMRGPEWMENEYSLRFLDGSSTRSNLARLAHTNLQATYEATTSTKPVLQVAAAWTSNPSGEQEALAPWFAVDKALKS